MSTHHNKYTIHDRITSAENRLAQLEAAIPQLEVRLRCELQKYADDHCHGMNGKDGRDAVDGAQGPAGPQGERGDVLYISPEETAPIIASLRAEIITQRARFQALVLQSLADNNGPHAAIFRRRLETLKREFGL